MQEIYNNQEARDCAVWLLQHAKELIEQRQEEFICLGIRGMALLNGTGFVSAVAYELKCYIQEAMSAFTYETFFDHHFHRISQKFQETTYRAGRVAWLADMIAALEKGERLPARPSLPPGFEWPTPAEGHWRNI